MLSKKYLICDGHQKRPKIYAPEFRIEQTGMANCVLLPPIHLDFISSFRAIKNLRKRQIFTITLTFMDLGDLLAWFRDFKRHGYSVPKEDA